MINKSIILLNLTLLVIGQSYPNEKTSHSIKYQREPTENIISFFTILRQIQRDIDQTKQSFNDVVRQNQYWNVHTNGDENIDEKCKNIIKLERTRFANYVLQNENEFEKCADQIIEQFKKSDFTIDLNVIDNEGTKCISIIRQTKFWSEYEKSKRNIIEICNRTED